MESYVIDHPAIDKPVMDTLSAALIEPRKMVLEASRTTPYIFFDPSTAVLEVKGRSSPENSVAFYHRIYDMIETYRLQGAPSITANFCFEYFNTSSAKCILDVFQKLERVSNSGKTVNVNWYYFMEDDDMLESGEDFAYFVDIPVNLIELDE